MGSKRKINVWYISTESLYLLSVVIAISKIVITNRRIDNNYILYTTNTVTHYTYFRGIEIPQKVARYP